jgi:hypothetical protein
VDRNFKYVKFCSQLSEGHVGIRTVLRAAGGTETTQQIIQNWLQLDGGEPGFKLLIEEISALTCLYLLPAAFTYIIKFSINLFLSFYFRVIFCFVNLDDHCPRPS